MSSAGSRDIIRVEAATSTTDDARNRLDYEHAMRLGDAVLRPRDLAPYEETPLYFAWQRLYAAGNATLSTDWLDETEWEMLERQRARVPPRRGLPPPTKSTAARLMQRESARASAFLRRTTEEDPYLRGSARMRSIRASMQALKERKLRSKREVSATNSRRHKAILKQIERELQSLQPPPKATRKLFVESSGALSNQDDDDGASVHPLPAGSPLRSPQGKPPKGFHRFKQPSSLTGLSWLNDSDHRVEIAAFHQSSQPRTSLVNDVANVSPIKASRYSPTLASTASRHDFGNDTMKKLFRSTKRDSARANADDNVEAAFDRINADVTFDSSLDDIELRNAKDPRYPKLEQKQTETSKSVTIIQEPKYGERSEHNSRSPGELVVPKPLNGSLDVAQMSGGDRRRSMMSQAHDGRRQRVDHDVILDEDEDEASDNEHGDDADESDMATTTAATADKRTSLRPASTSRASASRQDQSTTRASRSASVSMPEHRQSISRRDAGPAAPRVTHMIGQATPRSGPAATAMSQRSSYAMAGDEEEETLVFGRTADGDIAAEHNDEIAWQSEGDAQGSGGVNTNSAIVRSSRQVGGRTSIDTTTSAIKRQSKSSVTASNIDVAQMSGGDRRRSMMSQAHDGRRQRVDHDVILDEDEDEASDNEHGDDADESDMATTTAATADKRTSLRPASTSRASASRQDQSTTRASRSASVSMPEHRQSISRRDAGPAAPRVTHMIGQATPRSGPAATAMSQRSSYAMAGDEEEETLVFGRTADGDIAAEHNDEIAWQSEGDAQGSGGVNTNNAIVRSSRQVGGRTSIDTTTSAIKRQSKSSVTASNIDVAQMSGGDRRRSMMSQAHDGRRQRVDHDVILDEDEDEASDNEHGDDADESDMATTTAATADKRTSLRPASTSRASASRQDQSTTRASRSASVSMPEHRQSISRRDAGPAAPRVTHMIGQATPRSGPAATAMSQRSSYAMAGDEEEETLVFGRTADGDIAAEHNDEIAWQSEGDAQGSGGVNTNNAIVRSSRQVGGRTSIDTTTSAIKRQSKSSVTASNIDVAQMSGGDRRRSMMSQAHDGRRQRVDHDVILDEDEDEASDNEHGDDADESDMATTTAATADKRTSLRPASTSRASASRQDQSTTRASRSASVSMPEHRQSISRRDAGPAAPRVTHMIGQATPRSGPAATAMSQRSSYAMAGDEEEETLVFGRTADGDIAAEHNDEIAWQSEGDAQGSGGVNTNSAIVRSSRQVGGRTSIDTTTSAIKRQSKSSVTASNIDVAQMSGGDRRRSMMSQAHDGRRQRVDHDVILDEDEDEASDNEHGDDADESDMATTTAATADKRTSLRPASTSRASASRQDQSTTRASRSASVSMPEHRQSISRRDAGPAAPRVTHMIGQATPRSGPAATAMSQRSSYAMAGDEEEETLVFGRTADGDIAAEHNDEIAWQSEGDAQGSGGVNTNNAIVRSSRQVGGRTSIDTTTSAIKRQSKSSVTASNIDVAQMSGGDRRRSMMSQAHDGRRQRVDHDVILDEDEDEASDNEHGDDADESDMATTTAATADKRTSLRPASTSRASASRQDQSTTRASRSASVSMPEHRQSISRRDAGPAAPRVTHMIGQATPRSGPAATAMSQRSSYAMAGDEEEETLVFGRTADGDIAAEHNDEIAWQSEGDAQGSGGVNTNSAIVRSSRQVGGRTSIDTTTSAIKRQSKSSVTASNIDVAQMSGGDRRRSMMSQAHDGRRQRVDHDVILDEDEDEASDNEHGDDADESDMATTTAATADKRTSLRPASTSRAPVSRLNLVGSVEAPHDNGSRPMSSTRASHGVLERGHEAAKPFLLQPGVTFGENQYAGSAWRMKASEAVWPPAMDRGRTSDKRGFHPLVPPGMEQLVTEDDMTEYWCWLHWYSCWQIHYSRSRQNPKKLRKEQAPQHRGVTANWWIDLNDADGQSRKVRKEASKTQRRFG